MGRQWGWKKTTRMLNAPRLKHWFKKLIHRKNRRAAKRNPEGYKDKPLDPWAID
jgi:hypothetical protein